MMWKCCLAIQMSKNMSLPCYKASLEINNHDIIYTHKNNKKDQTLFKHPHLAQWPQKYEQWHNVDKEYISCLNEWLTGLIIN